MFLRNSSWLLRRDKRKNEPLFLLLNASVSGPQSSRSPFVVSSGVLCSDPEESRDSQAFRGDSVTPFGSLASGGAALASWSVLLFEPN